MELVVHLNSMIILIKLVIYFNSIKNSSGLRIMSIELKN